MTLDSKVLKRGLVLAVSSSLALANVPVLADQSSLGQVAVVPPPGAAPQQTAADLQRLCAPIALYPDSLLAQVLAAATYPTQVVEADRWVKQHPGLTGESLAGEVNKQSWDPSVKALTAFPSVLANLDNNVSWTSALGQAYVSEPDEVMATIQDLRRRAQDAGTLHGTSQATVTTQGQTIAIEPANPDVVYVPQYDPWLAYGAPVVAWPGWNPYPGLYLTAPGIAFGAAVGIGLFAGFGWGWHHWGSDWGRHAVVFDNRTFVSRNAVFINRRAIAGNHGFVGHGAFAHGGPAFGHGGIVHGGMHAGAFGHGGVGRSFAFHGHPGFGGSHHIGGASHFAGGFHGGHGGGFHGGGSHGGGHR